MKWIWAMGLALVVYGLSAAGGRAETTPTEAVPPASATPAPPAQTPARRDPFWPVNYQPKQLPANPPPQADPGAGARPQDLAPVSVVSTSADVDWQAARKRLTVGGLVRYRPKGADQDVYTAMINGRMVEPGDVVTVDDRGIRYRWRVRAIGPQGVSLTNVMDSEAARPE